MPGAIFRCEFVLGVLAWRGLQAAVRRARLPRRRLDADRFRAGYAIADFDAAPAVDDSRIGVKSDDLKAIAAESIDYSLLVVRLRVGPLLRRLPCVVPPRVEDRRVINNATAIKTP